MFEENQNGVPFLVLAQLLSHIRRGQPRILANPDLTPAIMFTKLSIIKLGRSGIRQDRHRILTFSILIISVEIKEIMGYLPLLPIVFDTPLSPFLRCFHIFVALPPFLIFLNTKNLLFAQVIKSTWNFGT